MQSVCYDPKVIVMCSASLPQQEKLGHHILLPLKGSCLDLLVLMKVYQLYEDHTFGGCTADVHGTGVGTSSMSSWPVILPVAVFALRSSRNSFIRWYCILITYYS